MGVEVEVHKEVLVFLRLLHDGFLSCPNGRVFVATWVQVKPIKIEGKCIQPVIATRHSIGIQDGDNLEHEVLAQTFGLLIPQTEKLGKKLTYSVRSSKNPFSTCDPGVSPGCTLLVKKITFLSLNR